MEPPASILAKPLHPSSAHMLRLGAVHRAGCFYLRVLFGSDEPEVLDPIKTELWALPWITKRTARHEYFMAEREISYSYGRAPGTETYTSKPFSECVLCLMDSLNRELGTEFNACFLNKYDDAHQHLGWHADDFAGMRQDQPIAVVSFGAEREIWVRDQRGVPCLDCREGYDPQRHGNCPFCKGTGFTSGEVPGEQRFALAEGSLFLMPVGFQDTHHHRIPKHHRACGVRISLTFRSFILP